jgi:hypothetical protein
MLFSVYCQGSVEKLCFRFYLYSDFFIYLFYLLYLYSAHIHTTVCSRRLADVLAIPCNGCLTLVRPDHAAGGARYQPVALGTVAPTGKMRAC